MLFNNSLSIIILEKLVKIGKRANIFNFNGTFTEDELDAIDELVVSNCDGLDGLSNLKNLKNLTIISSNLYSFSEPMILNNITDFSEINKLKNLESLKIIYDQNIEILDIRNLENIKTLKLFCNPNLVKIRGLSDKKKLNQVVVCECSVSDIGDVTKYIENTVDTATNIMDIKMYAKMFTPRISDFLKNQYNANKSNIKFGEHIYFHDEIYVIDVYQMSEMYKKVLNFLKRLNIDELPKEDQAFAIYKFVISYLSYDYEGLDYRNRNYEKVLSLNENDRQYILKRMALMNSSFGALTTRKAVCDGYVNLLKLLFTIYGIKSETVICRKGELPHAAIKYYVNSKWYYADPERDYDQNKIRYFGLTKEELSKIYVLSPKEDIIEKEVNEAKIYEKNII